MSVNVYKPHVLVLPEDDADRQIANGFLLDPSLNWGHALLEHNAGERQRLNSKVKSILF